MWAKNFLCRAVTYDINFWHAAREKVTRYRSGLFENENDSHSHYASKPLLPKAFLLRQDSCQVTQTAKSPLISRQ